MELDVATGLVVELTPPAVEQVRNLVDPFSAQYIRGALVDFSDRLTSSGFKITHSNARQSCGGGRSFTA